MICPECGSTDIDMSPPPQIFECQECGWVGYYDELEDE